MFFLCLVSCLIQNSVTTEVWSCRSGHFMFLSELLNLVYSKNWIKHPSVWSTFLSGSNIQLLIHHHHCCHCCRRHRRCCHHHHCSCCSHSYPCHQCRCCRCHCPCPCRCCRPNAPPPSSPLPFSHLLPIAVTRHSLLSLSPSLLHVTLARHSHPSLLCPMLCAPRSCPSLLPVDVMPKALCPSLLPITGARRCRAHCFVPIAGVHCGRARHSVLIAGLRHWCPLLLPPSRQPSSLLLLPLPIASIANRYCWHCHLGCHLCRGCRCR